LTLLSLLSALVVISTASMGMIYAQEADDSELTTFEEEALNDEEELTTGTSDDDENDSSAYLSGRNVSDDDDDTTATAEEMETEIASLFDGLVVCDLGTLEASAPDETETSAFDTQTATTPTVSVTVMSETEVAEAAANETETSAADETEVASAECFGLGGDDNATSTSSTDDMGMNNATSGDGANATSADGNATSLMDSNATGTSDGNATSTAGNATSSANATSSNATSTAADDEQIAVIEGQDFAPGEIVLVFSSNNIVAIDDVDDSGDVEAKVPVNDLGNDLSFVESGTNRSTEFNFDGQTLIAAEGQGEIQAEGTNQDELDIAEILRSGSNAAEIEGQDDESGDVDDNDDEDDEDEDSDNN
ncbi:MAG TPA: hypothetical protein VJ742_11035, partial [Nitrososphaera sp.]|nr:hypothetical protein [Nitrososphaera sp.]